MSCELFNQLVAANFIKVRGGKCIFEKSCPKTLYDCKIGDVLVEVDLDSKEAAVTEKDIEQSKILSGLEAEAVAKKRAGAGSDVSISNSINCVRRVN